MTSKAYSAVSALAGALITLAGCSKSQPHPVQSPITQADTVVNLQIGGRAQSMELKTDTPVSGEVTLIITGDRIVKVPFYQAVIDDPRGKDIPNILLACETPIMSSCTKPIDEGDGKVLIIYPDHAYHFSSSKLKPLMKVIQPSVGISRH